MLNGYRAANGLAPLTHNAQLGTATERHAADMATTNIIGHVGSNRLDPFQRMERVGYDSTWSGENVFWGSGWASSAMAWWKRSPEHNKNMLFPHFTEIGIARVFNVSSQYGWYWTTTFGKPRNG